MESAITKTHPANAHNKEDNSKETSRQIYENNNLTKNSSFASFEELISSTPTQNNKRLDSIIEKKLNLGQPQQQQQQYQHQQYKLQQSNVFNAINENTSKIKIKQFSFNNNYKNNNQTKIAPTIVLLDNRLIGLLILFGILIIAYKIMIGSVPPMDAVTVDKITIFSKTTFNDALNWFHEKDAASRFCPFICGLAISIFSIMIVYLDSRDPGVNPPSPFSSKAKHMYQQQKVSSIHLGYVTAIAAGIVCSVLMYFQL